MDNFFIEVGKKFPKYSCVDKVEIMEDEAKMAEKIVWI